MNASDKSPKVSDLAGQRGITDIVHFSTNLGLTGCLHSGYVLPRSRLKAEQQLEKILTLNAPFRSEEEDWFDKTEKWIDFVNLSVSEITTNLFRHSLKWHAGKDIYWVIMSFGIEILGHQGVYFTTTNNIYSQTLRAKGVSGFEAMFEPVVRRKPGWVANRGKRPPNLTTCEQAEVLYPGRLPMAHLRKVYVQTGEEADRVYALLAQFGHQDVQVIENAGKFHGRP